MKVHQKTADAPMHFEVNGVKFFAKGANWIPADNFPNRIPKGRLRRYVEDAVACNMNSLRFWGGGYYEEEELFDACDELGVCVWVDFKFAGSGYPAFDDAFLENVRLEVRDNLKRLRSHPSIAVLCGNNEVSAFKDRDVGGGKKMGANDYYKLFRDVIGGEVKKGAPQIDYVTGSPDCGDEHFWEVWHGGAPFETYSTVHGFFTEFGFQAFPDPKTVAAFTEPADRNSPYSEMILYHNLFFRWDRNKLPDIVLHYDLQSLWDTKKDSMDKIMNTISLYFRDPRDFESTIWLSQINQGYGIKYGVESWRREMPRSMGCFYWQFNDIWPCISWSSVDYFGRWKALQYMAAHFYKPLLVSGVEDVKEGKVDLYVTSDRMSGCKGKLAWSVTDVTGKPIKSGSREVEIAAHSSTQVQSIGLKDKIQQWGANNLIIWMTLDVDGKRESENMVTFVYPKELELMDPKLSADIEERQGEFVVTLKAEHPALWTWLDLEALDARYSDNFIHVTKEKPMSITVIPAQPMSKQAFEKALRIRSLFNTYSTNTLGKNP